MIKDIVVVIVFAVLMVATVISHRRFQKRYDAMSPAERDAFDVDNQTW